VSNSVSQTQTRDMPAGTVIASSLHELPTRLRDWILSQSQGPDGAFHAWRDAHTGALAFAYPEITGYALTYLAGRQSLSSMEVKAGHRAANWLVSRLARGDYSARSGWDDDAIYNFDLAMISSGLITFGKRVENDVYVASGISLADDIRRQVDSLGYLPAIKSDAMVPTGRDVSWSTAGRAHMVKAVQCLLLAEDCGMSGGRDSANRLVHSIHSLQGQDGSFRTQPFIGQTMLHPHLYTVEGLWMWSIAQDDDAAMIRARKALLWAWDYQLQSGGFPRYIVTDSDRNSVLVGREQMDLTAQTIRMTRLIGICPPGFDRAVSRVSELGHRDGRFVALPYQPDASVLHLNTWSTLFGVQALELVHNKEYVLPWTALV